MSDANHWGLRLQGHTFDLAAWKAQLEPPHDPWIVNEGDIEILRWSGFDGLDDASAVQAVGVGLLEQLNGAMAATCNARPVRSDGVARFDLDGTVKQTIVLSIGAAEVRVGASAVGVAIIASDHADVPPPLPSQSVVQRWLALGEQHDELADALVYFGRAEWFDIYKAIESLEDWVGGEKALTDRIWVSAEEFKRTKRMANSMRHRRNGKHTPPEPPVTLHDARHLVADLLYKAFDEASSRDTAE